MYIWKIRGIWRDFCPSISICLKYNQVGKVVPFFDSHSLWHSFKGYFVLRSKYIVACKLYIILSKFNHHSAFININNNIKKIIILWNIHFIAIIGHEENQR